MSHISIVERKKIYEMRLKGKTFYAIAKELNRPTKTIIQEFKRNQLPRRGYDAVSADEQAKLRKSKPRKLYKFTNSRIKEFVTNALKEDLSPEQISGRLESETGFKLSHEAIYLFVYRDKREGGDLYKHLRRRHRKRKSRLPKVVRTRIKNTVSIDQRPKIVDEKVRFGDIELDTVEGKKGSGFFVTAVDKATKKLWAKFIRRKTADETRKAILEMFSGIKIHTLTSDNGSEFACHQEIAEHLEAEFFFAHPYSSWERGLNEHTNGLLRQYFPKRTEFYGDGIEEKLQEAVAKINRRPRKSLKFKTPEEAFTELNKVQ
jgi:IS30 family transposase